MFYRVVNRWLSTRVIIMHITMKWKFRLMVRGGHCVSGMANISPAAMTVVRGQLSSFGTRCLFESPEIVSLQFSDHLDFSFVLVKELPVYGPVLFVGNLAGHQWSTFIFSNYEQNSDVHQWCALVRLSIKTYRSPCNSKPRLLFNVYSFSDMKS